MKSKSQHIIPPELIRALRRRECIPFIGAGVSHQSGLPLWCDIVSAASSKLLSITPRGRRKDERQFLSKATALEIFDQCKLKFTPAQYSQFKMDQFVQKAKPSPLHRLIAKLPAPFFVTTNFDELLELSIYEVFEEMPRVCTRYEQVVVASNMKNTPFVLKMHGTIQDVKSIVLAESEYDELEANNVPLFEYMRQTLDMKTALFLGYSLTDPDIRRLLGKSKIFTTGMRRDDFAVMRSVTRAEIELFQDKGVHILPIDSFDEIESLCHQIQSSLTIDEQQEKVKKTRSKYRDIISTGIRVLRSQIYRRLMEAPVFGIDGTVDLKRVFATRILKQTLSELDVFLASPIEVPAEFDKLVVAGIPSAILGGPGTGKSLILRYVAAWWCAKKRQGLGVYVPLLECDIAGDLVDIAADGIRMLTKTSTGMTRDDLEITLLQERSVICLDGLDEVPRKLRSHILRCIRDASDRFPLLSILLSSRGFENADLGSATTWEIQPLTMEDAQDVAFRWTTICSSADGIDLTKQPYCSESDLQSNPLSVAALCCLCGSKKTVYPTRTNITRAVLDTIMERGLRRTEHLSLRDEFDKIGVILRKLAFLLLKSGEVEPWSDILVQELLSQCCVSEGIVTSASDLLYFLKRDAGVLRPTGDGKISFLNRSVQELLVAEQIVVTNYCDQVVTLHSMDLNWTNTIRFIVGASDRKSQDSLVEAVYSKNPALGLACLLEVADWSPTAGRLFALENEDELAAAVRTLPVRMEPLQVVNVLESLFVRARRNAHLLYFAVEIIEAISTSKPDALSTVAAKRVLDSFWNEGTTFGIRPELVDIPGGEYFIGDDAGDSDERPRHRVDISPFRISRNIITNREFLAFVPNYKLDRLSADLDMPATNITWYEAILYARWILGSSGRLPTEAEWEASARAASDGRQYPWGDNVTDANANFSRSRRGASKVAEYPPNGNGLYDMAGNVFQWCGDWWSDGYYSVSPRRDPKGPTKGRYKVMRGGCWARGPEVMRCSYRVRQVPDTRDILVGFRVAESMC